MKLYFAGSIRGGREDVIFKKFREVLFNTKLVVRLK